MNCKLEFIDYIDLKDKKTEKSYRIYSTDKTIGILKSKEISQYFTDYAYKCLPHKIKGNATLLVLLGYFHF